MKLPQEWFRWERVQAGLKHYAPVLLVIAVGAALLPFSFQPAGLPVIIELD